MLQTLILTSGGEEQFSEEFRLAEQKLAELEALGAPEEELDQLYWSCIQIGMRDIRSKPRSKE